jgi:hypothetical protein
VSGLFVRRVKPLALMGSADTSSILLCGLKVPDIRRSVSIPGLTRFAIISHRPANCGSIDWVGPISYAWLTCGAL